MKQVFRNAFHRSIMNRATPYSHTNPKESFRHGKEFIKKNFNPHDPIFVKDNVEGRTINNLYTGYKLGGKGNLAVTGSLLAGGTIMASNPENIQSMYNRNQNVQYQSEEQDVESLQSTRADSLGYKAQVGDISGLNATGDLVFAMHKTRHTGQL